MGERWKYKKPVAVVTSIALAFSLAVAPGIASARDTVGKPAIVTIGTDVPEWAVDDGADAQSGKLKVQSALPSKYDLRSDGLVTPVKSQSPWGACWAFAGIAAAETSMLSATGSTAEENSTDLSERHLAYFALNPVTEVDDSVQAGEGMCTVSDDHNAAFNTGGFPIFITTLFSQGVGPQAEAVFPYRGVDAQGKSRLNTQALESDPEGTTLLMLASTWHMTVDEAKAKLEEDAAAKGKTYEEALEYYREQLKENYEKAPAYFELDDWSIPATDGSGNSNRTLTPFMTLRDGNVLPEYQNTDNTPNPQSIAAMKQELVNGHGVSIAYTADTARPGQSADTRYINRETWAQYTFEKNDISHAVCIVGYDDDYPASNFTHDVLTRETDASGNWVKDENDRYVLAKDENGQPYVDLAATAASTPPGNGAWIVKNSWGSETDQAIDDLGNVIGTGTYGVRDADGKATGYFYLSYYDKTISQPETMTFSPDLLDEATSFEVLQHDYMAAQGGFYTTPTTTDVTSSANVFETSQDLSIKAVSTRTSEENQRVTFAIYELKDGATEPTDGTLLYRTSRNFEYAGFHRLDLDWALEVKAGKKIAVVSTASTLNSDGTRLYSASANQALSKQSVEFLNGMRVPVPLYGEAVVNEGESFLYSNGQWVDWSKHIAALPKVAGVPIPGVTLPGNTYIEQFPIDNFSIKLYAVPAEKSLAHQEAKAATCTEPGNIEYWYYDTSEGQRLYYKDKDGKEKIGLTDTVIAPLGHKWGAWTKLDGEQHQRVCEHDSSHVEKADHDWDEGEVTTEPTATNDGVRTHICKDCGATKTESIPATGSALTHQEAKAATCTDPGNIEYWYYDTSEGQRQYYKDKDGKEKIELADTVIAPLGHKWGAWTKLDGDQHQRVCERDSSHVEKAEHVWDKGEVTTEPTATKNGVRAHICKDCGATKTESIPATGSGQKDNGGNAKPGGVATTGKSGLSSAAATPKTRTPSTGNPMAALPALAALGLSGLVLLVAGGRMYVGRRSDKGDES